MQRFLELWWIVGTYSALILSLGAALLMMRRQARRLRGDMSVSQLRAYTTGFNEGLEVAAMHCERCAELALTVKETNCSDAAVLYRWRAKDIRKMKQVVTRY